MVNQPKKIVEKVLETKETNTKSSYNRIANIVNKELAADITAQDTKDIVEASRELLDTAQNDINILNNVISEKPRYDFIDDKYIVYTKVNSKDWPHKERYTLPLELVDNIFNDYSRYWKNMSWPAIMNKYRLKPKVRQLIKSHIGLYKDSNILSPMSMDNAEKQGKIEEVITDATITNYNDKYKDKYKDADIKILREKIKKWWKILWTYEWFIEELQPLVNSIKPLHITAKKYKKTTSPTPAYVFGDLHLWKQETDKSVWRLMQMADDIIKHPSKTVYVIDIGDIFEAIMQWGMHPWQVETMDWMFGVDLFMYWVNVYVEFFTKILNAGKKVHFVQKGGNHDRTSQLNADDKERMFATIFHEMLKAYLKWANMTFEMIRGTRGAVNLSDNTDLIIEHEGTHKKTPEKTAWNFWTTDKHIVILSGHEHNEQIYTWRNVTHYKVNALAGKNDYDDRLWLFSYPWYAVVEENEFGIPNLTSKRLP